VLAEELAMVSLLMESVVVAFALGGVVGAVIAIHFLYRKSEITDLSESRDDLFEDEALLQREIAPRIKPPPRR
jgi:hypothetical protein